MLNIYKKNWDVNGQNLQNVITFANVAFPRRTMPLFSHAFEAVQIVN